MSAAAVIVRRRKRFIRQFRERNAVSPEQAIQFSDLGMRRTWIFDQLVSRGVLVSAGQDRYYMNVGAADAFLLAQRRRMLLVTAILLVIFIVYLIASVRW